MLDSGKTCQDRKPAAGWLMNWIARGNWSKLLGVNIGMRASGCSWEEEDYPVGANTFKQDLPSLLGNSFITQNQQLLSGTVWFGAPLILDKRTRPPVLVDSLEFGLFLMEPGKRAPWMSDWMWPSSVMTVFPGIDRIVPYQSVCYCVKQLLAFIIQGYSNPSSK